MLFEGLLVSPAEGWKAGVGTSVVCPPLIAGARKAQPASFPAQRAAGTTVQLCYSMAAP